MYYIAICNVTYSNVIWNAVCNIIILHTCNITIFHTAQMKYLSTNSNTKDH